jgi:hypothetical protein
VTNAAFAIQRAEGLIQGVEVEAEERSREAK